MHGSVPVAAGIGLRFQHHQAVLEAHPTVAWLEVHIENYMGGGTSLRCLEAIRREYPLSLHGIGLSLGSAEGVDDAHLVRVRSVVDRFEPGSFPSILHGASSMALTLPTCCRSR